MRSSIIAALAVCGAVSVACKKSGPDLALGPPSTFRVTTVNDVWNIGIDLEIRLPAGYESHGSSPFTRDWYRGRDLQIEVTTDPKHQETVEAPCGPPQNAFDWPNTVGAQSGTPDDLTTVCESRDGKELKRVWVVRRLTSIDAIIQCEVSAGVRLASTEERAAQLAICGSLRVLGRSEWSPADWLPPGSKSW